MLIVLGSLGVRVVICFAYLTLPQCLVVDVSNSETKITHLPTTTRGTNCHVISAQATISIPEQATTISFYVQGGEVNVVDGNYNELSDSLTDCISSPSNSSAVDLTESRLEVEYANVSSVASVCLVSCYCPGVLFIVALISFAYFVSLSCFDVWSSVSNIVQRRLFL